MPPPVAVIEANPTVRARSQRLHELVHAVSVGRGPGSRAVKAAVKALTPDAPRRSLLHAFRQRVRLRRACCWQPTRRLMRELRGRFKGEVRGPERVPRPRPREPVGL